MNVIKTKRLHQIIKLIPTMVDLKFQKKLKNQTTKHCFIISGSILMVIGLTIQSIVKLKHQMNHMNLNLN